MDHRTEIHRTILQIAVVAEIWVAKDSEITVLTIILISKRSVVSEVKIDVVLPYRTIHLETMTSLVGVNAITKVAVSVEITKLDSMDKVKVQK